MVNARSGALAEFARPGSADGAAATVRGSAVPVDTGTVGVDLANSLTFLQSARDHKDRARYDGVAKAHPAIPAVIRI